MTPVQLSEVFSSLESGSRPKGGIIEGVGDVPSLGAEHLDGQGSFNFTKLKLIPKEYFSSMTKGIIQADDILIVKDGATTGKVSFVDENFPYGEAAINEHVFCLRLNEKRAFPKYVFWHLKSSKGQRQILQDFRGATVGGISRGFMDEVKISLPSIPEQRRIAAILDKADTIHRKRQESIRLMEEFLRSVFLDMFGDPVTNPKVWPVDAFGDVIVFITSGSRGWAQHYSESGASFLRIQNVGRNKLILEDIAHVSPPENAEAKRTKAKPGDILLSITADLGRSAVIPEDFGEAYINQHLALLRVRKVEPLYCSAFIASEGGQRQIAALNKGGVKAGLNFNDIRSLQIPCPPDKMQKKWALIYQKQCKNIERLRIANATKENLFQSLVQRAFRGEL